MDISCIIQHTALSSWRLPVVISERSQDTPSFNKHLHLSPTTVHCSEGLVTITARLAPAKRPKIATETIVRAILCCSKCVGFDERQSQVQCVLWFDEPSRAKRRNTERRILGHLEPTSSWSPEGCPTALTRLTVPSIEGPAERERERDG